MSISTDAITNTSGTAPGVGSDSLTLAVGTSANTYAQGRLPQYLHQNGIVPFGQLRGLGQGTAPRITVHSTFDVNAKYETALQHLFATATRSRTAPVVDANRRRKATSIGSQRTFYISTAAIGQSGGGSIPVPATLAATSTYGDIWIDNTLSLSASTVQSIGADFDNAYTSDGTHFGTPEWTSSSPGAQLTQQPCDTTGNPIPGATPIPVLIPPPNGRHIAFVANQSNLGAGLGGYFLALDNIVQPVANCITGQPKTNEASMIVLGYNTVNSTSFIVNEDMVRGTAHEFQHLTNFTNHFILSSTPRSEDRWLNEGLSMLAQDFAVHQLFPSTAIDVDNALQLAIDYMNNPQNFSLTGFTGIEPNSSTFTYNCAGCYGAEYLFQRYLYDRFNGDQYTRSMESSGMVSYSNLQASTGQTPTQIISDFAVALAASNTGASMDPRFNFTAFNPYGTYTDQFGQATKLGGVGAYQLNPGQSGSITGYFGTFAYVVIQPTAGQGAGVTISDPAGGYGLQAALLQL